MQEYRKQIFLNIKYPLSILHGLSPVTVARKHGKVREAMPQNQIAGETFRL